MTDHTDKSNETDEQPAPAPDGGVQPDVRRPNPGVETGEPPSAETDGDGARHVRPAGEGADLQRIPEALRRRDQWLLWDAANDTPRRPHWRGDYGISWSEPEEWRSFEAAREAAAERESWGVGFVTAADNDDHVPGCYGVIDLDGCLDDERLAEWVPDLTPFVERGGFVERSPSETGLHIPVALGSTPEWWTDTHVSADAHEGIEVLANKFCTFTGDAVEGAGDEVVQMDEWLDEWLADAYERINGEDPRSRGDSTRQREARTDGDGQGTDADVSRERPDSAGRDAGEEWLTDEHVADALDALDPDMAHEEWVDIGFAIHDYDDGAAGKRLFTEWSKRGTKWDDKAEYKADHIWRKATPGDRPSNISVATLVHRAKRAGWSPPAAALGDAGDVVVEADAGGTRFTGPPEPVVRDDGTLGVVRPTDDGASVREVALGTWRCRNCEAVITETVAADTTASELAAPGECPGCDEPSFTHAALDAGDLQTALRAGRTWEPASGVTTAGFDELFDDVREHIRTYWDAGDDETADAVYAGLTAYALSTWVRENLTFVPHVLTLGRTTGGKTRLLNTLARVSYRAHLAADATPASMFRLIDDYDVTYLISEYHGLSTETRRGIDAILRAGQKRGEYVDRAEQTATGYEPGVFDPFTHIAVATQFDVDDDIKNRCIRTRSSGHHREVPATFDEQTAAALRDRLLGARFRLLDSDEWRDAEARAYDYLAESGIDGRTREKLLSLVACALVWDRLDDEFAAFVDLVVEQDTTASADSEDAQFVEAVRDLAFEAIADGAVNANMNAAAAEAAGDPFAGVTIPYSAVCERYEEVTGEEKNATWVGHVRKRLGLGKERRRDGTVITDEDLGETLRTLCDDLELDWTRTPRHEPIVELPDGSEKPSTNGCSECGRDRSLTHRWKGRHGRLCAECAEDIRLGRGATRVGDESGGGADEPVTVADEHATLDEHED